VQQVIRINNLCKSYGKGEGAIKALKNIELTINQGEFVAILGPSGSGKSTLMNVIGLMDTYDQGEYYLDGVYIEPDKEGDYSKLRNEKIGFIFQKFNLISKYTAQYNVALPLMVRGEKSQEALKKAKNMLESVGLYDRYNHRPNELSGGQQQRVAIARALIGNPPLILADEPTGNLDQKTGKDIIEMLSKLNKDGKTIVLITHDLKVADTAETVINLSDGVIA